MRIWWRGRKRGVLGRWVGGRVRAKQGGEIVVWESEGSHW